MKIKFQLLLMLFCANGTNSYAQNNLNISLKQAVIKAVEASKHVQISNAHLIRAEAQYMQAKANRLPNLSVSGQFLFLKQPNIQLEIPINNGQGGGAFAISPKQAVFGNVSASLPIFAGGQISSAVKAKEYLKKAIALQGKNIENEVIENAINAYYNLMKAQKAVVLLKENLQQVEQRVDDFTHMQQNGLLARNDLMKAKLQSSNMALTLLEARNNVKVANYSLDLMLGIDTDIELVLDSPILVNEAEVLSISRYLDTAFNNRPDYLNLDAQSNVAKENIKIAKADYYPTIALTGSYVNLKVPDLLTVTNALTGGVGLSYNIAGLYKNKAKVNEANSQVQQILLQKEALSNQIKTEVFKAYQDFTVQTQKIKVYEETISQADENYRITKNKYDNGLATTTELLDADTARLQAHLNLMYTNADKAVAFYHLQKVSGLLTSDL